MAKKESNKPKWLEIGSINKSEKDKLYIKIFLPKNGPSEIVLRGGDVLMLQKPQEKLEVLLEKGIITEEQFEESMNKIPEYVKYSIILPPKKD